MSQFKRWIRRLSLIPIVVYAVGTPTILFAERTITLNADGWLPLEIGGLFLCIVVVLYAES